MEMMSMDVESKIEEIIKNNTPQQDDYIVVEEKPKMTEQDALKIKEEAQSKAIVDAVVNSPANLINLKISQQTNKLIDEDENIKGKIKKVAQGSIKSQVGEVQADNIKKDKQNLFEKHKEDVNSMGLTVDSTKDKQFFATTGYTIWWYLFFITIGIFIIQPLTVLLNISKSLSYKIIKSENINGETKQIVETKKYGGFAIAFAVVFYILYLALLSFTIYKIVA